MVQKAQQQNKKEDPALVFGILSLVFGTVFPIGLLAVIMGVIGIVKSKAENTTGRILSIIGTVWGAIVMVLQVIAIVILAAVLGGAIGWLFNCDFDFSWGDDDCYAAVCDIEEVSADDMEYCMTATASNVIRSMIDEYVAEHGDRVISTGSVGSVDVSGFNFVDDRFLSEDIMKDAIASGLLPSYVYFYSENGVGVKEMAVVVSDWSKMLGAGAFMFMKE
jgi:hypothetical protein